MLGCSGRARSQTGREGIPRLACGTGRTFRAAAEGKRDRGRRGRAASLRAAPGPPAAAPPWGGRPPLAPGTPGWGSHARLPLAVTSPAPLPPQPAAAARGRRCGAVRCGPVLRATGGGGVALWRARLAPPPPLPLRRPPSFPPCLRASLRCPMFGLEKPAGQQEPGRSGGFPKMASVGDFNVLSSSIPATKVELSVSCRYGGG